MDAIIDFIFRKKLYKGELFIEDSEFPFFVFVILRDKDLVQEFGEEITIKTDFENPLPRKDDYPEMLALRDAIFSIAKNTPVFLAKRDKWLQKANASNV